MMPSIFYIAISAQCTSL